MSDITRDYSFGGWIKHFRLQKNLTLRAAAKELGIDVGNLCRLEKSEIKPPKTKAEIERMLKILDAENSLNFMANLAFQDHLASLRARFR